VDDDGRRCGGVAQCTARTAPGRRATGAAARIFGIALLTVSVLGLGVVGTRVAQSASPQGIASSYPTCATALLARSPTTQRVFTAYGTGGYVIYRLWPRASVYEYGESISLGTSVFAGYQRSPPVPSPLRPHCNSDSSDTTAVLYSGGPLTDELNGSPQWTEIIDNRDHGMLLFLRGNASWAAGGSCAGPAGS